MFELALRFAYFVAGWGVAFLALLVSYLLVLALVGSRRP